MRRGLSLLFVLAMTMGLVAVATTPALASKPFRYIEHRTGIVCGDPDPVTGEAGAVSFDAATSDVFGQVGFLVFWAAPADPNVDPATYVSGSDVVVSVTDNRIEATFELIDTATETPIAQPAILEADFAPDGDPFTSEDFREGNTFVRDDSVFQPIIVTEGALTIPGYAPFDVSGCPGSIEDIETFQTSPETFVDSNTGIFVNCQIISPDYALEFFAADDENEFPFAFTFLHTPGGGLVGSSETITVTDSSLEGTIPVTDTVTGAERGDAVIEATVTRGPRISFAFEGSTVRDKLVGNQLLIDGTITFPTTPPTEVDLDSCDAFDGRTQHTQHFGPSPKPSKPPVNDAPDGALLLGPKSRDTVSTSGAAVDPEEPCIFDFGSEAVPVRELPLVNTVWYKIVGTGGHITIDTAGTDFDSVLGVYTADGDSFQQVACEDDTPLDFGRSLQAKATFDTDPGVTYYIQAGGFDEGFMPAFGRLKLSSS